MNYQVALPDTQAPAGPEILVFDEDATKGQIIYDLTQRIPLNEFGLPDFFFRSDLIHGTSLDAEEIDACTVGLFYMEGYPTLQDGTTFWNQLPHEPYAKYELFQAFLDQADDIGIRQLDLLAADKKKKLEDVVDASREFFWSARARAYDLFIVAAEAKKRQRRIMKMENSHFDLTGRLIGELQARFINDEEGNWIEELNAKEAAEVLEMLVKIQRMSVGLTGQHASSTARDIGMGESSEAIIRKLAQGGGVNHASADKFGAMLQHMLEDPESGATIQAAILKVTAPNNKSTFGEEL